MKKNRGGKIKKEELERKKKEKGDIDRQIKERKGEGVRNKKIEKNKKQRKKEKERFRN